MAFAQCDFNVISTKAADKKPVGWATSIEAEAATHSLPAPVLLELLPTLIGDLPTLPTWDPKLMRLGSETGDRIDVWRDCYRPDDVAVFIRLNAFEVDIGLIGRLVEFCSAASCSLLNGSQVITPDVEAIMAIMKATRSERIQAIGGAMPGES